MRSVLLFWDIKQHCIMSKQSADLNQGELHNSLTFHTIKNNSIVVLYVYVLVFETPLK